MALLRWGICGSGRICHDFSLALQAGKDRHCLQAVAARNLERAREFAKMHNISTAYGDYKQLAEDIAVDIVYIGVIHPHHFETTKLFLNAGKHVLCEKPLTLSSKETTTLCELAKKNNVFLAEGLWSRYFPIYKRIRQIIDDNQIGDVQTVAANFCSNVTEVEWIRDPSLGGGALYALGVYTIQFALWIYHNFGYKLDDISSVAALNSGEVDETTIITMKFANSKLAVLTSSASSIQPNTAVVSGTLGCLTVEKFWCPTKLVVNGKEEIYNLPDIKDINLTGKGGFNCTNSAGFIYEADAVRTAINAGLKETAEVPWSQTIAISEIVDTVLKQVGYRGGTL